MPGRLSLLLVAWVLSCGHGAPPGPSASSSLAAAGGVRVRVVTWNVQHGYSIDKRHVNQEQIAFIASLQPDVVALQELAEWDNDMPTIYHQGLESRTGRRWSWRYEADLPAAPASRRDGNALATTLSAAAPEVLRLDDPTSPNDNNRNRSVIRIVAMLGGVRVDLATTHLDYLDAADRRSQVNRAQAWLGAGDAVRIVAGDFNAEPGDSATWSGWRTEYSDAWVSTVNPQGGSPGFTMPHRTTTGQPGRIDYQWYAGPGVQLTHVEVVQTDLSDHYALVADYQVAAAK
jgi:endonuclease/exonuclease/phosphatase family metal-dependent hydrolase